MRASSAVLVDTSVRLWDLRFPSRRTLLARTRGAYIHLDNLIAYSKRDRDGKVDAYLACYLPDEVVLLFFHTGELVNAAMVSPVGRFTAAISEALRHIRSEPERSEICFHEAPAEQLAAMYASCEQSPLDIKFDVTNPQSVFRPLVESGFNGLLELMADGKLNYLRVSSGRYAGGWFAECDAAQPPTEAVARLFQCPPGMARPNLSVKAFPGLDTLPHQATPALVAIFRRFAWDLVDLAEREMPGDAAKRAERLRTRLAANHEVLRNVGGPRGSQQADPITEPAALADGVAAWSREFLGELEIIHPGIAPRLLREAAREHRFALNALGFFEKLPWPIAW